MLRLYIESEQSNYETQVIEDAEAEFRAIKLYNSDIEQKIISEIDQGTLKNQLQFIDRFGETLSTSYLSTGCKAVLVALHRPTKLVSFKECGYNARDIAIQTIKDGNILIKFPLRTFGWDITLPDIEIDVELDGYHFTSLSRLNDYFTDERPYTPDLETPGIEKLEEM